MTHDEKAEKALLQARNVLCEVNTGPTPLANAMQDLAACEEPDDPKTLRQFDRVFELLNTRLAGMGN